MRRLLPRFVIGLILLAGVSQLAEGTYIHAKALLAQLLLHSAWQQTLDDGRPHTPWDWADAWPIARLRVPHLEVDQIVLADSSGRSLAFGPGLISGTTAPGEPGNTVLAGHRDTHFRFIQHLLPGDTLQLQGKNGKVIDYRVTGSQVIDEDDTWILAQTGRHRLGLVSCYPFDAPTVGGPLRYVVHAARLEEHHRSSTPL